jgi:IS5 family transposase
MSHQLIFADSECNNKRRKTRKETFLACMNELIPWDQLEAIIEPFHPKGNGRKPYSLSTMFRIHCMQHWYNMSDPAMEDTLYEVTSMRLFADLSLDSPITSLDS